MRKCLKLQNKLLINTLNEMEPLIQIANNSWQLPLSWQFVVLILVVTDNTKTSHVEFASHGLSLFLHTVFQIIFREIFEGEVQRTNNRRLPAFALQSTIVE